MKVSNFRLLATTKNNVDQDVFHAVVDITTGRWWKKTKTLPIRKSFAGCWMFVDNGMFAPDEEINNLALHWAVENGDNSLCHFRSW